MLPQVLLKGLAAMGSPEMGFHLSSPMCVSCSEE
jgi:hypothetical protein